MQTLILKNHPIEGPGTLPGYLAERGVPYRIAEPDEARAATLDGVGRLVVLGGPMAVYEADQYPALRAGMRLMEEALKRGIPVLGLCLGSQMAAHVLGKPVYPGKAGQEQGWYEITFTPEGMADPLMAAMHGGAKSLSVFHWHGDTFDLPEGAARLASSDKYLNQGFRYGKLYALQFHPEMDLQLVKDWAKGHAREREIVAGSTAERMGEYLERAKRMYDAFLAL